MAIANRGIVLRQLGHLFGEGTLTGVDECQLLERYLTRRDEGAFEALLNLHGPMVLAVCRRILREPRDVEDAFQATFLVFVRRAPAIRDRGLLSNWLYGVAFRVATRARNNTIRRRGRELAVAAPDALADPQSPDLSEIGPVLDQELSRLPGKYRAALVLCYLKGQTHDQAAQELKCPVGTVRSRLARGRDLLKRRLTRRGFAPTAVVLVTGPSLPIPLVGEAVPASLIAATVKAAFASGAFTTIPTGTATAAVLALTQGMLMSMKLAQLKWVGVALLATGVSAGGAIALSHAKGQSGRDGGAAVSAVSALTPSQERRQPATEPLGGEHKPSVTTEDRLRALEQKLDQLLNGGETIPHTPVPIPPSSAVRPVLPAASPKGFFYDPFRATESFNQSDLDSPVNLESRHGSIRQLLLKIKLALEEFDRIDRLYQQGNVELRVREAAGSKVLLNAASLEGLADELDEQSERLELEIRRKQFEVTEAEGQQEAARSVCARNARLNARITGAVGAEDVAKAEAELKAATARVDVKRVEVAELVLRKTQAQRQVAAIRQALRLAEQAKPKDNPNPTPVPNSK